MDRKTFTVLLIVLGIFFLVSLVSLIILNPILWLAVYETTDLRSGTVAYAQWTEPQIKILFEAYFFNLTNPNEFRAGHKPIVKQVGPYTYRERRRKLDIVHRQVPKAISYREVKEYHFDRNLSIGDESDVLTTVSLGFLAIDVKFGWLPSAVDRVIELLENYTAEHLIIQLTVRELMWGYEDQFLKFLKSFHIPVPTTMIGLYLNKNQTDDGIIEIYSSNKMPETFGHIRKYHGSNSLTCWKSDQANMINGSDGSLFHPYIDWSEEPYIFSADICRSVQLRPKTKVKSQGVPVIKYLPFDDTFESPLKSEKNRGFCIDYPNCMKDNMIDVSTCYPGSPITMSLPHFLYADQSYKDSVLGLNPTEDLNTTFEIEPQTGVVFFAAKKLQINAAVKNNIKFNELANVKDVNLPIMFMNESFTLDEETARTIRASLVTGPLVAKVILTTCVVVILLACIGLIVHYWLRRRHHGVEQSGRYNPITEEQPVVV